VRTIVLWAAAAFAATLLLPGCGGEAPTPSGDPASESALTADPAATQELQEGISKAINEAGTRYLPLSYRSSEDLLSILDRVEARLAGRAEGPAERFMAGTAERPGIDEREELDHFRETIRRWEAKSGRGLREAIDPLKAEVEARAPGASGTYPEFHKRFSEVFDSFIKVEVEEMRERRNRAIHERVGPLLDKYRGSHPDLVRHFEADLNAPPYNLPPRSDAAPGPARAGEGPPAQPGGAGTGSPPS
jgi:hypothetical protein